MFWKIVFSFSAECLKSSGNNNIRKKAAGFCHMLGEADKCEACRRRRRRRLLLRLMGGEQLKPSRLAQKATKAGGRGQHVWFHQ